ncbi:TetR/AcrR family transcriptional regulator [Pseudomonas lopnurensis]|uniref:TetR/AcrR family transcriptional regulator n=1 Tax=Pseudomonas lopnurensis TaxID=1477517 RepID=UPI0028B16C58|nr:TetR/AcrR family transcriptional regulator [Pseudomonas lopnurensis]
MPAPHETDANPATSRKRATLERLLLEARRIFAEKGLAGTRLEEIASAAGVTRQLIYQYFSSKEKLFASVLDESTHQVVTDLLSLDLDDLPPRQALRVLLEHQFDHYGTNPELRSLAQESFRLHERSAQSRNRFSSMAPPLIDLMERILRRGAASGDFMPSVDARMLCGASVLLTTLWFTSRHITSTATGFDTDTPAGIAAWRSYAIDFVLSAVLTDRRPPLDRPQLEDE